jgi:hypothetical protein
MNAPHTTPDPILRTIKNGWAAYGDGWAVHAPTREEAIQKYWEAVERHRLIESLPYWFEQVKAGQGHVSDKEHPHQG